jgi:hypothetical protein
MLYGLYGSVPDLVSIDLSNVILFLLLRRDLERRARVQRARALARLADRRRGALAARLAMVGFEAGRRCAGQLSSMIIAATPGSAYEFWRWTQGAAGLALAGDRAVRDHGAMFLLRTPLNALLNGRDSETIFAAPGSA